MNKLYKEVAKELNQPEYLVEKICKHPFKFIKAVMEDGNLDGVMLPLFGKFIVKPGRKKHFEKYGENAHIQDNEDIHEGTEGVNT